jgi:flavodoxin
MQRFLSFALLFCVTISQLSCSRANADDDVPTSQRTDGKRILIVYLSRTENTKTVAEIIQQQVGGDLVGLELVTPYPKDYRAIVAQVDKENETGFLPPLKTRVEAIKDYDTVFVGFPTWDMQLPPPMKSFLRTHDLTGKTVIPFNTNGGYGKGSSFETVKELCALSNVLEGLAIDGGREREGILLALKDQRLIEVRGQVARWLRDIRVAKP